MRRLIAVLLVLMMSQACSAATLAEESEIENYTRYTDYVPQTAEPVGLIAGTDHGVLVAWFSRVGNTVFDPDVDVVSTASLQVDASGELTGNAQMIQTAYTYPSDYDQTVEVGEGQDIDRVELKLAAYPEDLSGYDTVWLVVPIWHYTICTPLRVFLNETDLSGKTVYVVTTHRGSGFADVPERVQEMEPGAQVIAALAIPGNDAPKHRDEVLDYVKNNMK